MVSKAPRIKLSNGIIVANFSSPHPFNFEDGNVLEACSPDRVAAGALERTEQERPWGDRDDIVAVTPVFKLSDSVIDLLEELHQDTDIDVVLIPFPVLEALKEAHSLNRYSKAGTICVKDRLTKAIYINKFCR